MARTKPSNPCTAGKKTNARKAIKKAAPTPLNDEANSQKQYQLKPGTVALREIRKQQQTNELLMSKACFAWLVREATQCYASNLRYTPDAILALQHGSEAYIVGFLKMRAVLLSTQNVLLFRPRTFASLVVFKERVPNASAVGIFVEVANCRLIAR